LRAWRGNLFEQLNRLQKIASFLAMTRGANEFAPIKKFGDLIHQKESSGDFQTYFIWSRMKQFKLEKARRKS